MELTQGAKGGEKDGVLSASGNEADVAGRRGGLVGVEKAQKAAVPVGLEVCSGSRDLGFQICAGINGEGC